MRILVTVFSRFGKDEKGTSKGRSDRAWPSWGGSVYSENTSSIM